jgi:hypothetical protein
MNGGQVSLRVVNVMWTDLDSLAFILHFVCPYANTAKYLGMTFDAKLRWKELIKKKKM